MFQTFRYLVLESKQLSLLKNEPKPKEVVFKEIIDELITKKKEELKTDKKLFLFYGNKKLNEYIYLLQFSTRKLIDHHYAGQSGIYRQKEENYPFVWIILDRRRQIILVEEKKSVISVKRTVEIVGKFLINQLEEYDLSIAITPKTKESDFWQEVQDMEKISFLEMTIPAPNYFKGRHEVEEFVNEQYQDTDFSTMKITYKSVIGKLKVFKEVLGHFITYISDGGGSYILKGIRKGDSKGKAETIRSESFIIKSALDGDEIETLSELQIEKELMRITNEKFDSTDDDSQIAIPFTPTIKQIDETTSAKNIHPDIFRDKNKEERNKLDGNKDEDVK